jgi:hypothetical protein
MAVSHIKSDTIADFTGTITGFNSQGSTTTIAATDLVRPSDWNSAHNQFYSLVGNTIGNSTASGSNVIFAASGGISIGGSTGTVVVSAPSYRYFNPYAGHEFVAGQQGQATLHLAPVTVPTMMMDRYVIPVLFSGATNSTGSLTGSFWLGLYTRTSNSLSLFASQSASTAITYSGTANSTLNSGPRIISFAWTTTVPGDAYWIGFVSRTTTGGANATLSHFLASQPNSNWSGYLGSVTTASVQVQLGLGQYSATTSGMPGSVAFSQISGTASNAQRNPLVYFVDSSA